MRYAMQLFGAFYIFLGCANNCQAAIVLVPDAVNQTGNFSVNFNSFAPIGGEDSVYVSGRMTFDLVARRFFVAEVDTVSTAFAYQWGKPVSQNQFNFFLPGPVETLDADLVNGESHLVVLKIDQTSGNYDVFFNPDLSLTEQANTPLLSRTGGPTDNIINVGFRGNGSGIVDYTDFRIHTGQSTPFSAVPEPSSALLISCVGMAAVLRRRRRQRHSI